MQYTDHTYMQDFPNPSLIPVATEYSEANVENRALSLGNFNQLWQQKEIFTIRDFLEGFKIILSILMLKYNMSVFRTHLCYRLPNSTAQ